MYVYPPNNAQQSAGYRHIMEIEKRKLMARLIFEENRKQLITDKLAQYRAEVAHFRGRLLQVARKKIVEDDLKVAPI